LHVSFPTLKKKTAKPVGPGSVGRQYIPLNLAAKFSCCFALPTQGSFTQTLYPETGQALFNSLQGKDLEKI